MNKRHLDAYIRRQTRAAVRYYTDADVKQVATILAGTGIGTVAGIAIGRIIGKGISWLYNKIADRRILQQILDGTITEDKFVKNFVDMTIQNIDTLVSKNISLSWSSDFGDAEEKGADVIKQRLRRCRTVKGLLKVMPNNVMLQRMDRILSDPRVQEKMGIERLGRDVRSLRGSM